MSKDELSPRMREIATMIARGYSNPEIADELGLSVKTIGAHRHVMMRTLGVHTTAAIVHYALSRGWVEVGDLKEGA